MPPSSSPTSRTPDHNDTFVSLQESLSTRIVGAPWSRWRTGQHGARCAPMAILEPASAAASAARAIERADIRLGRRIAETRDHPLSKAASRAGKLGDQEPLYVLAGGLLAVGVLTRRSRLAISGVRVGLAVVAADLVKSGLKNRLTRTRPHVLLDDGVYRRAAGGSDQKPSQSFPSGHMAGTAAAAAALARSFPATWPAGLALATALGVSRVSKGAHWPLDVAAGALIGLATEAATALLLKRWDDPEARAMIVRATERPPPSRPSFQPPSAHSAQNAARTPISDFTTPNARSSSR
jgi:membrane-associated phospholipid phosphatase